MKDQLSGVLYKQNFLVAILIVFILFYIPKRYLNRITLATCLILTASCFLAIFFGFSGLLTGVSFDAALLSLLIIVLFYNENLGGLWVLSILGILIATMYVSNGMTAFLILCSYALGWMFIESKKGFLIFVVLLMASLKKNIRYFTENSNGRYEMWDAYLTYWTKNFSVLSGSGPGSFEQIGPLIPVNGIRYIWAHNDWLQIFLEYGLIGLLIFICLYGFLLFKSYANQNYAVFMGLIGFGTCMMLYSPFRVLFGVIFFVWLARSAFEKKYWGYRG